MKIFLGLLALGIITLIASLAGGVGITAMGAGSPPVNSTTVSNIIDSNRVDDVQVRSLFDPTAISNMIDPVPVVAQVPQNIPTFMHPQFFPQPVNGVLTHTVNNWQASGKIAFDPGGQRHYLAVDYFENVEHKGVLNWPDNDCIKMGDVSMKISFALNGQSFSITQVEMCY